MVWEGHHVGRQGKSVRRGLRFCTLRGIHRERGHVFSGLYSKRVPLQGEHLEWRICVFVEGVHTRLFYTQAAQTLSHASRVAKRTEVVRAWVWGGRGRGGGVCRMMLPPIVPLKCNSCSFFFLAFNAVDVECSPGGVCSFCMPLPRTGRPHYLKIWGAD